MDPARPRASHLERAGEVLSLALVCLSPWAFGAVEAWAELALELGIAVLAVIAIVAGTRAGRTPHLLCVPSVALIGLIGLALLQATPLSEPWLRRIAPAAVDARATLAPATAARVRGDTRGPVAPPAPTLSEDPEETLRTAARLTAAWVLFQAVLALGGGYAALRRFGLAIAGNAALLALFSVIQALSWNGKIYWLRPSPIASGWSTGGPFVGHSPLAAELNLGLGFALAFLFTPSHRRQFRPWAAYMSSVIAVGIVASHSRTGFLAMVVATLVFAAALRFGKVRPGAGIGIGVAAMLVLVPVLLIAMGRTTSFSRIGTIAETSSYSARLEIWTRAIESWRERPLWGSGLGTFAIATTPHFRHDLGLIYLRAENEYLDVLVEAGLTGLSLLLLILASVAYSGYVALRGASTSRERFVVLGALFGTLTLAIHSLGDFALHIPAVGVAAVVLVARICGLALDARRREPVPARHANARSTARWAVAGLATVVPITLVSIQGVVQARAEAALAGTGLPLPGSAMPDVQAGNVLTPDLEARRAALEAALALRPNWAEGHLRLGLTYLGLYRRHAQEWLGDEARDPNQAAMLADPVWLHGVVHTSSDRGLVALEEITDHEPVRRNLVPAARSFLEARRCCPWLALAHAELAQLDYLVDPAEPVSVHATRALRLAGGSADLLALVARTALQADDVDLACRCWRAALAVRPAGWIEVADTAGVVLPPETILTRVLTPGGAGHLVRFAERLYAEPEDAAVRARFHREALARLPGDASLPAAERSQLEARAFAALGEGKAARHRMEEALRSEPGQSQWRQQLVLWLIEWGDPAEARRQAMIGIHFDPGNSDLRRALEAAAEALAHGEPSPVPGGRNVSQVGPFE